MFQVMYVKIIKNKRKLLFLIRRLPLNFMDTQYVVIVVLCNPIQDYNKIIFGANRSLVKLELFCL